MSVWVRDVCAAVIPGSRINSEQARTPMKVNITASTKQIRFGHLRLNGFSSPF